jgi:hypothetical protein
METMRTRVLVLTALLVMTLVAGACSSGDVPSHTGSASTPAVSGPRPTSTAKLSIVTPTNGQVIHGGSVALKVSLRDAKIVPLTTTALKPDEGHLHVILDDQLISMTTGVQMIIPDVPPGQHLLKVEFVATDHAPFDPRVIAVVSFQVKA